MPTYEEIYTKVSTAIVAALSAEEADITPTTRLQGDLGAESIDFLDIMFRLEREFGIEIKRDELFPESVFKGDPEFVQDGRITDRGMAEVKAKVPFADFSTLEQTRSITAVSDLFTVGMIARWVEGKLNGAGQDSPKNENGANRQDSPKNE
jgi:acyl carrier protein